MNGYNKSILKKDYSLYFIIKLKSQASIVLACTSLEPDIAVITC